MSRDATRVIAAESDVSGELRTASAAVARSGDASLIFRTQVRLWDVLGHRDLPIVGLRPYGKVLSLRVAVAAHAHQPVTARRIVGVQTGDAAGQAGCVWQLLFKTQNSVLKPVIDDCDGDVVDVD